MAHFHFGPLTPDLGQVLDIFEIDLSGLLKYLAGTDQVSFRFASSPAFFVELGKVDIQMMEVRCRPARSNGRESTCIRLCDLRDKSDKSW